MRKVVLYSGLLACFLFALLLESLFTRPPAPTSEAHAAVTLGDEESDWIEIPSEPPAEWEVTTHSPPDPSPAKEAVPPRVDPASEEKEEKAVEKKTPVKAPPPTAPTRIVVKDGETLWDLAKLHLGSGTRHPELAAWNKLREGAPLMEGAVLRLSPPSESAEPSNVAPAASTHFKTHRVVRGDTLSGLAEKYLGDSSAWRRIRDLNHLKSDTVLEGVVLRIPSKGP